MTSQACAFSPPLVVASAGAGLVPAPLPAQQEVLAIAGKGRPYRSLATSYLFSATFAQAKTPPAAQRKTERVRARQPAPRTRMLE